jgi:hypothetical protein
VLPGVVQNRPLQKKSSQASLDRPSAISSTPGPSRLARGLRQVVEYAQDISDDTRKFGKEVLEACAGARYAEVSRSTRDRNGQSSTISLSGIASTGRKMDYFPQSIASLTNAGSTSASGPTTAPSLKPLYQVLISHSRLSAETDQRNLPHESHVLGTLLYPFLTPSKYPIVKEEEEKATAVEVFELILKIWTQVDEVSSYLNDIMNVALTDVYQVGKCRALLMVY